MEVDRIRTSIGKTLIERVGRDVDWIQTSLLEGLDPDVITGRVGSGLEGLDPSSIGRVGRVRSVVN